MSLMLSVAAGLAHGGMAALCLGLPRHFRQVWQREPTPALRRGLRAAGWGLLALALPASAAFWGWAMGPVAWFGLVSLSGLLLALLLPYRPRLAAWLPLGWLPVMAVLGVVQGLS